MSSNGGTPSATISTARRGRPSSEDSGIDNFRRRTGARCACLPPQLQHQQRLPMALSPSHTPPQSRMLTLLSTLYLPSLLRRHSIRKDIRALTSWSEENLDEELRLISQGLGQGGKGTTGHQHLPSFLAHIRRCVENKPHTVIAYAWVLYLVLFSEGRMLRKLLENSVHLHQADNNRNEESRHPPEAAFWLQASHVLPCGRQIAPSPHLLDQGLPLSFWQFDTGDGSDDTLKREFKRRLSSVEGLLTRREKDDVVKEAVCLFENLVLVVTHLDGVLASHTPPFSSFSTDMSASRTLAERRGSRTTRHLAIPERRYCQTTQQQQNSRVAPAMGNDESRDDHARRDSWVDVLGTRVRDSIAVAKHRMENNRSDKGPSSDEKEANIDKSPAELEAQPGTPSASHTRLEDNRDDGIPDLAVVPPLHERLHGSTTLSMTPVITSLSVSAPSSETSPTTPDSLTSPSTSSSVSAHQGRTSTRRKRKVKFAPEPKSPRRESKWRKPLSSPSAKAQSADDEEGLGWKGMLFALVLTGAWMGIGYFWA